LKQFIFLQGSIPKKKYLQKANPKMTYITGRKTLLTFFNINQLVLLLLDNVSIIIG